VSKTLCFRFRRDIIKWNSPACDGAMKFPGVLQPFLADLQVLAWGGARREHDVSDKLDEFNSLMERMEKILDEPGGAEFS